MAAISVRSAFRAGHAVKSYIRTSTASTRAWRKLGSKGSTVQRLNKLENKVAKSWTRTGMKHGFGSPQAQSRRALRNRVINRRRGAVMFRGRL